MFVLAIDSKLRGYDVVSLTVEDVAQSGVTIDRATVRQKKTGHPVRFELSEQTREAVDAYIRAAHQKAGEFLFTSRRYLGHFLTTRQYCWATAKSKALFGISASRWTMLWLSPSRSMSELPGQSRLALPSSLGRLRAKIRSNGRPRQAGSYP